MSQNINIKDRILKWAKKRPNPIDDFTLIGDTLVVSRGDIKQKIHVEKVIDLFEILERLTK